MAERTTLSILHTGDYEHVYSGTECPCRPVLTRIVYHDDGSFTAHAFTEEE